MVVATALTTREQICGQTPTESQWYSKILNGNPAQSGQFPWQAGIRTKDSKFIYCGGTLITRELVLTAAHCFNSINESNIEVVLGEHDIAANHNGTRIVPVAKIIRHPKFNTFAMHHDIALLQLQDKVKLSKVLIPACLPCNRFETYSGWEVWTSGWGIQGYENGSFPTALQYANLTILPDQDCRKYFGRIPHGSMCAMGQDGRDACTGDSGGKSIFEGALYLMMDSLTTLNDCPASVLAANLNGPLMAFNRFRAQFEVVGVVSWGIGCGMPKTPGVYSRLTSALDFVYQNIILLEGPTKPYK
eukprot:maker-scaffold77_size404793-snap-gene-2.14 protein:Tk04782 transcript:maker-scaffold77_size404793-snap-gene-2.14-mRNA-1 annotation:"chymotrypsinogen 2-like"